MEIETKDYSTKKRLLGKLDCIICDSGGLHSRFPSFKKKKKKRLLSDFIVTVLKCICL